MVPPPERGNVGGLFASVNLAASSPGVLPARPSFAMPSAHTSATKNPFGGISLTVASKPEAPAVTTIDGPQAQIEKLVEEFKKQIAEAQVREDHSLAVQRFMTTYFALKNQEQEAKENILATTTKASADSGSSTSTASIAAPASSLSSVAPAPLPFSFGGSTTAATQPPTSDNKPAFQFGTSFAASSGGGLASAVESQTTEKRQPAFSFGTNMGVIPSDGSSPAPASSGFNFAPAPMASSLVPGGTTVKIALTPVPGPGTEDGEDDETPEEKTELASADTDWNELRVVQVKFYHHRNEGGKAKMFAKGQLKVQQNKKDAKIHRMVMRDPAGKVLINIGIFNGMTFVKINQDNRQAGNPLGGIRFFGAMDESRGPEKFLLMSSMEDIEELHKQLEGLSS